MNKATRFCGWFGTVSLLLRAAQAEIVYQAPGWLSGGPGFSVPLDLDGVGTPEFSLRSEGITCGSLECGVTYLMSWGARDGCEVLFTAIPAPNDNFAARAPLVGDYLEVTANNTVATTEIGEPDHAGLSAGASLWWTWTAPTNGWVTLSSRHGAFTPCFAIYRGADLTSLGLVGFSPVKCAVPGSGDLESVSQSEIFRVVGGESYQIAFDSLTNLELVAANPVQDGVVAETPPLHHLLHFATRSGETYALQVSSRWWGVMPLRPSGPCDPSWITGYPFAMDLEFVPHSVGKLDMAFSPGLPPLVDDSILFFFAAARGSGFVLETSTNLVAWNQTTTLRTVTGGMEVVRLPSSFVYPSRFFRVRLEEQLRSF